MGCRVINPEPCKPGLFLHQPSIPLCGPGQGEAGALAQLDVERGDVAGVGGPDGAGEVPKVHRLAVCDEEDLAGDGVGGVGGGVGELVDHALGGEDVGVSSVLDVCEIKEVVVCAELELGLAVFEHRDHRGEHLPVAGPFIFN